jgi:hypothetical protein
MLVLVLCLAALGLVACGGGGDDDGDVSEILADTFGEGKEVKSGRLDLSVKLNAQGVPQLSGPVTVRLSGPFESSGSGELPKFAFEASLEGGGQALKAGAVSTSEKGFVTFQDQAYVLSDELFKQFKEGYAEQARCNEQRGKGSGTTTTFSALGVNPRAWLRDAKKAGTEEVGGADTTHITGTVDVPKLLEDVNRILARTDTSARQDPCAEQDGSGKDEQQGSRTLSEAQRKQIADAIKSAKVDIWTGAEDRTLRRINVAVKFEVPEGERKDAGGLRSGDLAFDMTIGALNEEQDISEPEDAKPFEELLQQLNGTLGGGGSGSGSGGGAQGGATGGSKYEQCLADAGQDVAKLQECADLVGQ